MGMVLCSVQHTQNYTILGDSPETHIKMANSKGFCTNTAICILREILNETTTDSHNNHSCVVLVILVVSIIFLLYTLRVCWIEHIHTKSTYSRISSNISQFSFYLYLSRSLSLIFGRRWIAVGKVRLCAATRLGISINYVCMRDARSHRDEQRKRERKRGTENLWNHTHALNVEKCMTHIYGSVAVLDDVCERSMDAFSCACVRMCVCWSTTSTHTLPSGAAE